MTDSTFCHSTPCNIVVLISGSGSNLQAIIDDLAGHPTARICAVVSNRADAYGLLRAQQAGIATHVLNHKDFVDRLAFDTALMQVIDQYQADLVVLAGFMRILTPEFTRHYAQRLLNIHPSLLPKYKGLHTHQRAIAAGDQEHGCSVHFVTEELDGGPLVIQAVVPISASDDAEQLAQRVHALEHQIYPLAVRWFAEGRLHLSQQNAVLDGQPLASSGFQFKS
jgi:phosphoribosylglycinamide formyltransferase-1